jgi:hypothetical protein
MKISKRIVGGIAVLRVSGTWLAGEGEERVALQAAIEACASQGMGAVLVSLDDVGGVGEGFIHTLVECGRSLMLQGRTLGVTTVMKLKGPCVPVPWFRREDALLRVFDSEREAIAELSCSGGPSVGAP